MTYKQNPRDEQASHTGKVVNDHNKVAKRTSDSRTDREAHLGSSNQTQSRRGHTGH